MERGEKRSYDTHVAAVYQFSETEFRNFKIAAEQRPTFYVKDLDYNTKMSALKASSFVVSLVSFSGDSILSQNCGAIIETNGNTNTVITSLNLIRQRDGTERQEYVENTLAENLKVIIYANDGNWYLGEICFSDFVYNLVILKFKSTSLFQSANSLLVDDSNPLERDFIFRPHSTKAKCGDNIIVVGRYFNEPHDLMAAPGVISLDRFRPDKYDCNELLTISSRFSRCGDGAPVVSISGELIGITFYDLATKSPLLPINIINKMMSHFKEHGVMRHPSYGFDARNVHFALLPTLDRFRRSFPNVGNGIFVERVFEGHNAELAGLEVDDVIFACDGNPVKSFFELWDLMFSKVGAGVELQVARVGLPFQTFRLKVDEASEEDTYMWPRYD